MVAEGSPDKESLRLELQEAIVTTRHWSSLLTQTAGFITTADVVLISYGFVQKLSGIILLASVLPISVLLIYLIVRSRIIPLITLVLRLERRLRIRKDSLGATFARTDLRPNGIASGDIEDLDDEQVYELNLSGSMWRWLWRPIPIILYAATAAQLSLFVLALTVFHHPFM